MICSTIDPNYDIVIFLVKASNIKEVVDAGANIIVGGSSIFGHDDINKAVEDLRNAAQGK